MDNKKHTLDLESFRNIIHICPRVQGQTFAELPFEEEILDFIRFLIHSATIRTLTDVNINKLYQPWRSFAAVINKCLTGKTSGYDSLRLSQAQILWGLYHKRNVDYAFLIWEDFMYQVEHKNHKKSNEMYYPRFTKVIIHHFMSSKAYKEYYAIATGEAAPKPKASVRRTRGGSDTSIIPPTAIATPRPTAAATLRLTAAAKGKQIAKAPKAKSLSSPSEPGGSGIDEGTVSKPEVPNVPIDESEEELSWNSSDDDSADDQEKVEKRDGESFDPIPQTPKSSEDEGDGGEDQGLNIGEEERLNEEEEADELYRDVDIHQGMGLKVNQEVKDSHVILTPVHPDGQQESSSVSSQFVTNMLNPTSDAGIESIFATASTSVAPLPITAPTMTLSIVTTITTTSQAPIPTAPIPSEVLQNLPTFALVLRFDDRLRSLEQNFSEVMQTNQFGGAVFAIPRIVQHFMDQRMNEAVQVAVQLQSDRLREEAQKENDEFLRTVDENIKKIIKEQVKEQVKAQVSKILPRIKQAVNKQLEAEVLTRSSHSSRTSYAVAADLSEMELKKILIEKIEGNKSIQCSDAQRNLYKALVDAYESDKIILDTYGETVPLKRRRDDDEDKDKEPSAGPDRGSKRRIEGKETEAASTPLETATKSIGRSTTGSRSRQASISESAFVEEPVQTTSQMEEPSYLEFEIGADDQPIVQSSQHPEWFSQPKKPPSLNHDWNKTLLALRVDTLTPELLAGPTYDLVKGSCRSLIELEYHLEEVYKATIDQLDWVNPEGPQYPHNLLQPLPLIPDNRGLRVIPFAHFINNDIEYLRGGASSRKYTTSVTKMKAADYGHSKWIEDLFYGFTVNQESARDVYSKRRIIAVTKLKIVEWHSYKHLDWITVRCDNDKLYKFKEGNLKRLRIQDIEDMLLLLVQGKLTNLTVEERFAFNVSLRIFTRSIIIQRRVEDLQLGVESYQKKLNLTKPDTYRSDLKHKEAYIAYSNLRGFIYQNKDKQNRLMRIDELHKFSDGTLTDVRTALDDRLKGIRMQYLPQTIWR
nr:hypothetical protein [Tanacetum cinerariifolium]